MNTKNIIIIFIVGIIVVGGVSVVLLESKNKDKPAQLTPDNEVHVSEATKKHLYEDIIVTKKDANPSNITIKRGWEVRIVNNELQDLNIIITGKSNLVVVGKEKEIFSPAFTEAGDYKFVDRNNPNINGKIIVE
jgi:plastocyanin